MEIKLKKITLFKKSKKGFVLSIWWFIMVIIIASTIYTIVNMFFQSPLDIREMEVNSLINQVSDCIYYAGRFNVNINSFSDTSSINNNRPSDNEGNLLNEVKIDKDFLIKNCNLNLFDENHPEEMQYFIQVNVYELKTVSNSLDYKGNLLTTYSAGNENFKDLCSLQLQKVTIPSTNTLEKIKYKDNNYKTLPFCKDKKFYAFTKDIMSDGSRKEYLIEVIGGINKLKENVKI